MPNDTTSVSKADLGPPVPSPQPAPVASTPQAVDSQSNWVVQLATFSKTRNASDLERKLRDKGYPVFLESQAVEKGTLTRVYVGPLEAKDEAQTALKRLEKQFKLKGIVLQRKAG
jgi:cell division septation protein DedD